MTTYEIASLILGGVTAAILIAQLRMLRVTLKADHERRKKQATLDIAANMVREERQVLQQEFGIQKITEKDIDRLKEDKISLAKINKAFGVFEHISVGLEAKVYDTDLFEQMFGNTFVEIFDQYHLYIAFRRQTHGVTVYTVLEKLVIAYRMKRELSANNNGNILHSHK